MTHKFMWTGLDSETSLAPDDVWRCVDAASAQVKGKFLLASDSPLLKEYDIKGSETLFATAPELTFDVRISEASGGRRAVRTRIVRTLLKDSSLPFGPKTMLGHKAYMRFAQALVAQLSFADPSSTSSLRDGPMPAGFPIASLRAEVLPPAAQPVAPTVAAAPAPPTPAGEVTDPATTQLRLQEIAATNPELRGHIAVHPNIYPALADWIAQQPRT